MALNLTRGGGPLIIAGPCSAESCEQLLRTARELAATGSVDVLRAGLWKPRTRPDSFEGVGERGLAWLRQAKEECGLPIATEVASARHAELALRAGVDLLWIGARTTVNPFLVQEIADAVSGSEAAILIKNPMHPDIDLWSGAVERLKRAGIPFEQIGLVHRGFSTYKHWRLRNDPMWHLLFEMQQRFPHLPILCDPSHISGSRDYLEEIAQTAANLNLDGLMIESHCTPELALSDAEQQITPSELKTLLETLCWRVKQQGDEDYLRELGRCRGEIDQIDHEIFDLLSRRMKISDRIGEIKHKNEVIILQNERWNEVVQRVTARADQLHLSREFLLSILEAIHLESIAHQNRIKSKV